MAAVSYPTINGFAHEFNAAIININGEEFVGITSIDYESSLEPGEVRGTRPQLLARTRGQHKASASLEMLKKDAQALVDKLGEGFGTRVFEIVCSYPEDPETPETMITDKIRGCRVMKLSAAYAEGSDPLKTKIELSILDVRWGGKSIVPDSIY